MRDVDWTALREQGLKDFTLEVLPPTIALPALPVAVSRFIERSQDERASLRELASIVQTDTGLTVELLRHVNSAFMGLREKAKSVQQAIAILGIRQSKLFLIATGTKAAVLAKQSRLIHQARFWQSSLQRALFARELAELLRCDTDLAFAGALMQDYLLPVITNTFYDAYAKFTEERSRWPECLCDYEDQVFQWNHARLAASLAVRWKLPDDLVCCLLYHHRGLPILADPQLARTPVAAVALSALLPDQLHQTAFGMEQLIVLQQKWPSFKLEELIEKVDQQQTSFGLPVDASYALKRRYQQIISSGKLAPG